MLNPPFRLKLLCGSLNLLLYLTIIYLPYIAAKTVKTQINRTRRRFETIAFNRSVNCATKQKIESLSELSDFAGFTCFDWFLLDSKTGLKVKGFKGFPLV